MAHALENTSTLPFTVKLTDAAAGDGSDASPYQLPFTKGGVKPEVLVENRDGDKLVSGKDYTVSYKNNRAVSKSTDSKAPAVVVKGKGNYTGTIEKKFEIIAKDLTLSENKNDVYLLAADKVESTKKQGWRQSFKVYDKDGKTLNSRDCDIKAATYTLKEAPAGSFLAVGMELEPETIVPAGAVIEISVKMKGENYTGTVTGTYRILKQGYDISKATIQLYPQQYTKNAVTIDDNGDFKKAVLKNGKSIANLYLQAEGDSPANIRVVEGSYVKNVEKGTARVTFEGIGQYGGRKTVSFKIVQRPVESSWNGLYDLILKHFG